MIQVEDLSISFGDHLLFDQASFSVQTGEKLGLVGRNGSGKSTLFKILSREMQPDSGKIHTSKGYRIGTLTQHIDFTEATVLDEAVTALPAGEELSHYKAEKILAGLGIDEGMCHSSPRELSGGFQLRLHLAKVLISEPDCLLLDEPTNYLDIVSLRWLKRFLREWQRECVIITHDREFMDAVVTSTIGIHRHRVQKFKGGTEAFYTKIVEQEEVYEKTRQNIEKKKSHAEDFIRRFGAKATKAKQAQSRVKMIEKMPALERLQEIDHLKFQFRYEPFRSKKMLEAEEISFAYQPEDPVIEKASLQVGGKERIAVIGKNGRGKSTFLKLLAGELKSQEGSLFHAEKLRVGYFGQTNIDRLHPDHSIYEEVAGANPQLNFTEVKALCGMMMFSGDLSEKPCRVLSGGERARVLLAKILASSCNLLLLDEPTHHLDMESVESLIDAMEDFPGALILVTHSELILRRLQFDQILVCRGGRQELFTGSYPEFLEKGGWGDEKVESAKRAPQLDSQKRREEVKRLHREVKRLEKELTQKEAERGQIHEELLVVSGQDHKKLADLSKREKQLESEIEMLYEQLDRDEKALKIFYT